MIQTLVAVLMWALVASLLVLRRRRSERSITYAAVAIGLAMTLNVDAIYISLDSALGAMNITTFFADVALMMGLFFLARGIMKVGAYRPPLVGIALGLPTLILALMAITVTFIFIDKGVTTTTFMIDLGSQPAAAAYSMIEFTYCAIVLAAMMTLAGRQYRLSSAVQRIPAGLLLFGSTMGVGLCVVVVAMDVSHLRGNLEVMDAIAEAYGPLYLLTFLFLCAGLAGQSVLRHQRDRTRHVTTEDLAAGLEPIWHRARAHRPGLSQIHPLPAPMEDSHARLHRQVVEIRDAMIDPRVSFEITEHQRALLTRGENHLLGRPAPGMKETQSHPRSRQSQRGHT